MGKRKGGVRPKLCQKCGRPGILTWFKRRWTCERCLNADIEPLNIEDFTSRTGQLGDDGALPGERTRPIRRLRKKEEKG